MRHRIQALVAIGLAGALLLGGAAPAGATLPGRNGRIAYAGHDGTDYEIFTMKADGTDKRQLTSNTVGDVAPAYSPDGTKIAFQRKTNDQDSEIYVMNADGSNVVRLTNNTFPDFEPAWSPDGSKIAFARQMDGDFEIMLMNANGSSVVQLTDNGEWDREPVFSPDGTKILYAHVAYDPVNDLHNFDIFRIRTDGTNSTRITDCYQGTDCLSPDWSPDGTKITYTRWNFNNTSNYRSEVWTANADGSAAVMRTASGGYSNYSAFSPDGKYLLYSGGDTLDIVRLNLSTGATLRLSSGAADEWGPDWQRV